MKYPVTLIPGDGIGPEVVQCAQKIISATGVSIDWHVYHAGADMIPKYNTALPPDTLASIQADKVALKGPITTPIGTGFRSVNVELRKSLQLYANFRPARKIPGIFSRYEHVDLIVVRESTEGLYCGIEYSPVPGVVESLRVVTEKGWERVVKFAFETARKYHRKKVTAVHKANILKMGDGLFLDIARKIAPKYSEIVYEEMIIDATAMKLVTKPEHFDIIVTENLFGDVLSDLTAGLIGGLGIAPSANFGDTHAIFEAVHGSAPDIAGKGVANPTAIILSSALMLKYLGEHQAGERIENAVSKVLGEGKVTTQDLAGTATSEEYTNELIAHL